jgi:hypothetical protein
MAARLGTRRALAGTGAVLHFVRGAIASIRRDSIAVKATNRLGQTQVETLIFNPAGYHNNVIRPTKITVV